MRLDHTNRLLTVPVLVVALATPAAFAQQQHGETAKPAAEATARKGCPGHAAKAAEGTEKAMDCKQMMAKKKEMMAKLQAMDATLERLVQRMKSATGDDKIAAMEAVLEELVAQRTTMRQMMMQMQHRMMHHMMRHMRMKMGMEGGEKGSKGCPMMEKKGGEEPEQGAESGAHSMHH